MDGFNITRHKLMFATQLYKNGSFPGTVSIDVCTITTTTHRRVYHQKSNRFKHVLHRQIHEYGHVRNG